MGVTITNRRQGVSCATSLLSDHLHFGLSRLGENLGTRASLIEKHLAVRCGIVCSLVDAYLKVEADNIWLLPENDFTQDVVVYSNVKWIIE